MQYGTYVYFNCKQELSKEERLNLIRQAGYEFVGLDYTDELADTVRYCEKIGMPIENVHLACNGTSYIWVGGEEAEAMVENYCRQIKTCADLGITAGIAHVTYGPILVPPSEEGLSRYARIVECAEKHNFRLCVENSKATAHLGAVMDRFRGPNVRFCYDSGHDLGMAWDTEYFYRYLPDYGDRLAAVHIHDSIKGFDMHMAPFDGAIDWERVAKDLAATQYGRQKLCAEIGGRVCAQKPGKTAAELRQTYKDFAIIDDESLVKFHDGYYTVYDSLSPEEILERYLNGLKKIAKMIGSC